MKNMKISEIIQNNYEVFVQFKIMEWTDKKVLESLENPLDVTEARKNLTLIISKNRKFKNYIPLENTVIDKILAKAFTEKKEILKIIEDFIRKNASLSAKTKIEAVMVLWDIANNWYIPISKIDY